MTEKIGEYDTRFNKARPVSTPKSKERVNLNVCQQCEHEETCFWPLHFLHWLTGRVCRQGRKKKQFREKQATLEETAKDQT